MSELSYMNKVAKLTKHACTSSIKKHPKGSTHQRQWNGLRVHSVDWWLGHQHRTIHQLDATHIEMLSPHLQYQVVEHTTAGLHHVSYKFGLEVKKLQAPKAFLQHSIATFNEPPHSLVVDIESNFLVRMRSSDRGDEPVWARVGLSRISQNDSIWKWELTVNCSRQRAV